MVINLTKLEQHPEEPPLGVWKIRDKLWHLTPREWGAYVRMLQRKHLPLLPYSIAHRIPKTPRILIVGEPRSGKTRAALWLASEIFWDVFQEHKLSDYYTIGYRETMRLMKANVPVVIQDEAERDFQGSWSPATKEFLKFRTFIESQAYKNTVLITIHHAPPPAMAELYNYIVVVQEKGGRHGWSEVYRTVRNVKRIIAPGSPNFYAHKIEAFRAPLPPRKIEEEFRKIEPELKRKIEAEVIEEADALAGKRRKKLKSLLAQAQIAMSNEDL